MIIATCYKNTLLQSKINKLLSSYLMNNKMTFKIYNFCSLSQIINMDTYDFLFINLTLSDEINQIQKLNDIKSTKIIFTYFDDDLNTIHFIEYKKHIDIFNKFSKYKDTQYINISFKNNQRFISLDDILYIEAINKEIGIRTFKEFILTRTTLYKIAEQIKHTNFISPHRSYIVNMNFIKSLNNNVIIMNNNEKISISRLKKQEIYKKYNDYMNQCI